MANDPVTGTQIGTRQWLEEQAAKRKQAQAEEEQARQEEERQQRAIESAQAVARQLEQERQASSAVPKPQVSSVTTSVQPVTPLPQAEEEAISVPEDRGGPSVYSGGPVERVRQWWETSQPGVQMADYARQERERTTAEAIKQFSIPESPTESPNLLQQGVGLLNKVGLPQLTGWLGYPLDVAGGLEVPGTGGLTVRETVGAGVDALMTADRRLTEQKQTTEASPLSSEYWRVAGNNVGILFDTFGDMAQYWQDEADAMRAGVVATPEQLNRSSPEQIAQARNLARFSGWSGADYVAKSFDAFLDNPVLGDELLTESTAIAQRAYALPPGPQQDALLLEAGKKKAEAVRLMEMTPLEIYNENSVWWKELAAGLIFDPTNFVGGVIQAPLEALGVLGKAKNVPMAVEAARAARLGNIGETARMGVVTNWAGELWRPLREALQLNQSKALVANHEIWKTFTNVLADFETKGDVVTVLSDLVLYPEQVANMGIELGRLTSAKARLQAVGDFFIPGQAAVKRVEFTRALKSIQDPEFVEAIRHLDSLQGAATDIVDKNQLMGDLNGLIQRWTGQSFKVSAQDGVPYGSTSARIVQGQTPGTAQVEFLKGKQVIGRSVEMTPGEANRGLRNAENSIKRGVEYTRNPIAAIGDAERRWFSSTAINSVLSSILNNVFGGSGVGLINVDDARIFNSTKSHLDWMMTKGGGFYNDLRVAVGAGNIPGPAGVTSAGFWGGTPEFINYISGGLIDKGRKWRNYTEEAMGVRLKGTAERAKWEEAGEAIAPKIKAIIQRFDPDARRAQGYTDKLVQAYINGTRADVAQVAREIAQGAPAISLRSLSKAYPEMLDPAQVKEVEQLLSTMTEQTLPQVAQRIDEIFQDRIGMALTQINTGAQMPKRYFWTEANRMRDRAEMLNQLDAAAQLNRITPEQYRTLAPLYKEIDRIGMQADEELLGFLQLAYGRPDTVPTVYGAWMRVQDLTNDLRRVQADLHRQVEIGLAPIRRLGAGGAQLLEQEKARLWPIYYQMYTDAARTIGVQKLQVVRDAQRLLDSGAYMQRNPLSPNSISRFFGAFAVNEDDVRRLQEMGMAFADDIDARLFNQMKDGQRAVTDKYTAFLFSALQNNPTLNGMDEYMSAIHDANKWIGAARYQMKQASDVLSPHQAAGTATAAMWNDLRAARQGWVQAHQKSWERLYAGAVRIVEGGLADEVTQPLRFEIQQLPGVPFRLVGERPNGKWQVVNEATGRWFEWDTANVPPTAITALPGVRKAAEQMLAEQLGFLARQAGIHNPQTGLTLIDDLMRQMQSTPHGEIYRQLQQTVAEHIANGRPATIVPAELENYMVQTMYGAEHALLDALPKVLELKRQGVGAFGPEFINAINREILPQMSNDALAASYFGAAARSKSLVDYINSYWPDAILSTVAPYHFWFSRMAKNSLEQMILNPAITSNMTRLYNRTMMENLQDDKPLRNMYQIPGVQLETEDAYIGFDLPFARWLPLFPLMTQNGWADPERTNMAYEYIQEGQEEGGWPGSRKTVLGNVILAHEMMKRFGFGTYPWIDAAIDRAAGKRVEANLGSMGAVPRLLGWGGVKFANWLRDQGALESANLVESATSVARPFYEPYLVGRQASNLAQRGILSDTQAQNVQDVGYQRFFGEGPLPEQLPEAEALYRDAQNRVASDYFLRQLIAWAVPTRVGATYKGEMELRAAADLRNRMGYEPGQESGGSKAAQTLMFDEVPGLGARGSQYAVTGEIAPQVPDPNAVRPGIRAVQGEFFDKQAEIKDRYAALIDEQYAAHPEWAQPGTGGARNEILAPIWDQRQAELDALAAQYPSMAEIERQPANAPQKLTGTNPREARDILMATIFTMAKQVMGEEPVYPEGGSRSQVADYKNAKAAYDQELEAEMQRLMAQPDIGQLVPGRELPGAGIMPEAGDLPPFRGPLYRNPATTNIQNQGSSDIPNPWSAEMQATEQQYGLPQGLLSHIAQAESGFDPTAKSDAGAIGLMQFMLPTWGQASEALGLTDINDPVQQVQAAGWYLDWIKQNLPPEKQDLPWVLAAYNWGIGNASKAKSLDALPPETQGYIAQIVGETQTTPMAYSGWQPPGEQSQAFGNNPAYYEQFGFAGHEGVDYAAPEGTPVAAAAGGTVIQAGAKEGNEAYGNYVVVKHNDGTETWYAHLSGVSVRAGDTVRAGDVVGAVGSTGNSTGNHLHFAVRQGEFAPDDPYKGFVDPAEYLAQMQTGTPSPVGVVLSEPVSGAQGTPAPNPSGIDWGGSAADYLQQQDTRYMGPNQLAITQQYEAARQAQTDMLAQFYPEYVKLRETWDRTNDEDREAFRKAHPEITAVNLLLWNPEVWREVEGKFGEGVVLTYARRPEGEKAAYWHQHPEAFLAGAWLNGRPEPRTETGAGADTDFSYNAGADFAEAERLFGPNVWGVVQGYWQIDPADKAARKAFRDANPTFGAWEDWWYAKLPDQQPATYAGYYLGGRGSSGFSYEDQWEGPDYAEVWRRSYESPTPPKYTRRGGVGSNWERWINIGRGR